MQAHIHLTRLKAAVESDVREEFSEGFEGLCLIMWNKTRYMHLIAN